MFRIIAIRVTSENSVGKKKLLANEYYYLYGGYTIDGTVLFVDPKQVTPPSLYNNYLGNEPHTPFVSISAIVGENGSGKSSLIEFLIRIINNWGASTIGEYKINPGANHLHYINELWGELFYTLNGRYYCLSVQDRNVELYEYGSAGENKFVKEVTPIFDNQASSADKMNPFRQWRSKGPSLKDFYKNFFYTFISNFSIYAYNILDFENECVPNAYEGKIRNSKSSNPQYPIGERAWLNGLFHKNDGYQTPIVLTPWRDEGNININTENHLAKERLISLMIMSETGDTGFRIINGHLKAVSFTLAIKNTKYDAPYLKKHIGFKRLQKQGYDKFEKYIH